MRVRLAPAPAAHFRWAGAAVLRPIPEALPNLVGAVAAWLAGGCRPRVEAGSLQWVAAFPHPWAAGLRLRLAAASGRQER